MLTLIAPTSPGAEITAAMTQRPGGWCHLHLQISRHQLSFLVSADGYIKRD